MGARCCVPLDGNDSDSTFFLTPTADKSRLSVDTSIDMLLKSSSLAQACSVPVWKQKVSDVLRNAADELHHAPMSVEGGAASKGLPNASAGRLIVHHCVYFLVFRPLSEVQQRLQNEEDERIDVRAAALERSNLHSNPGVGAASSNDSDGRVSLNTSSIQQNSGDEIGFSVGAGAAAGGGGTKRSARTGDSITLTGTPASVPTAAAPAPEVEPPPPMWKDTPVILVPAQPSNSSQSIKQSKGREMEGALPKSLEATIRSMVHTLCKKVAAPEYYKGNPDDAAAPPAAATASNILVDDVIPIPGTRPRYGHTCMSFPSVTSSDKTTKHEGFRIVYVTHPQALRDRALNGNNTTACRRGVLLEGVFTHAVIEETSRRAMLYSNEDVFDTQFSSRGPFEDVARKVLLQVNMICRE